MSEAVMDWDRAFRVGLAEAVFSESKSAAQLEALIAITHDEGRPLLFTRLPPEKVAELSSDALARLDYDPVSRTAVLGTPAAPAGKLGRVGIITGGISDLPAATEAERTLRFAGAQAEVIADVGVAGLWRLMDRLEEVRGFDVLIAVAGMEGAIFSVLAGLVQAPIIALPVSVGAGVAQGGHLALHSALGSCAPGLTVVNIDNGFGAAQAALRILRALSQRA